MMRKQVSSILVPASVDTTGVRLALFVMLGGCLISESVMGQVSQSQSTASESCVEFVRYRDTTLFRDWDKASRAFDAAAQSIDLTKKIRSEIAGYVHLSDPVALLEIFTRMSKLVANGITDLLRINQSLDKSYGIAIDVTEKILARPALAAKVLDVYYRRESPEEIGKIVAEEVGEQILKGSASTSVSASIASVYHLADNLKDLYEAGKTIQELKSGLLESWGRTELELRKLDASLDASRLRMNAVQEVRATIDRLCGATTADTTSGIASGALTTPPPPFGVDPRAMQERVPARVESPTANRRTAEDDFAKLLREVAGRGNAAPNVGAQEAARRPCSRFTGIPGRPRIPDPLYCTRINGKWYDVQLP